MGNSHRRVEHPCIFCEINTSRDRIIYEDDLAFVFEDIKLNSAQRHILVCPKTHIKNINHLSSSDIPLLEHMESIAKNVLSDSHPKSPLLFGYHSPPFYSIKHLHLHGLVLPITSCYFNRITYGVGLTTTEKLKSKLNPRSKLWKRRWNLLSILNIILL